MDKKKSARVAMETNEVPPFFEVTVWNWANSLEVAVKHSILTSQVASVSPLPPIFVAKELGISPFRWPKKTLF